MKKFFFSIVALAAIATGCSMSEVENNPGANTPISFDTYFGKAATKAVAYQTEDLRGDGFTVFAYDHADGETPDYTADAWHTFDLTFADPSWSYGNVPVYWPANGNKVDFFTYPTVNGVSLNSEKTGFTFAVSNTPTEQVDLVAALASLNQTAANGAVQFTFKHLLSRVAFVLENTGASAITVSSVKLYGNFFAEGSVKLIDDELAIVAGTAKTEETFRFDGESEDATMASYELMGATPFTGTGYILPDSANADNKYMMLIPAEAKGIAVTYSIDGDASSYIVTKRFATPVVLAASSAYKFTLKVSTDAIEFQVTDSLDWGAEVAGNTVTL